MGLLADRTLHRRLNSLFYAMDAFSRISYIIHLFCIDIWVLQV